QGRSRESRRVGNASAVAGRVAADSTVAECQRRTVGNATPVTHPSKAIRDGETGDSDVGREIFKDAGSGVAVDRQRSGTGTIDGDAGKNLKFAAGQQDGAGDAGGVNRVAVVCINERLAQRAWAAVIGICDYDDVSWQRIACFHQSSARAAELCY